MTNSIKALTFDVFGTVVDWRSSIIEEGERLTNQFGYKVEWEDFADRWRAGYSPAMERVRQGDIPWTDIDNLHRMILDELVIEFALTSMTEKELVNLNRVWHRLKPWDDAVEGLNRLKRRFTVATLSNGNISLLENMARFANLSWDQIFSAENFGHYKPDAETYMGAVSLLGLKAGEVMMVAAHPSDLEAAAENGLRTGYVARPLEWGHGYITDHVSADDFDIVSSDFLDLAAKLGA
ncbi:MAG: haloacid dehalogenase type II [Candidatus Azotimanducaceae bacterium]|uniref:(S)-2-haloacid dehalogenase n=1 Tax=OM182 bacterium TaxID=2510334 RepID=A0A520S389_9GAMM|nr:haloacid dehalogenase type II [Gammaproteobacteria bacterium]RZO76938.1 MAG: haloacid dehalogenase type II [OM182 bacterium]